MSSNSRQQINLPGLPRVAPAPAPASAPAPTPAPAPVPAPKAGASMTARRFAPIREAGSPAAPVTKTISVTRSPHKGSYILLPVKDASGKIKGATRVMITAPLRPATNRPGVAPIRAIEAAPKELSPAAERKKLKEQRAAARSAAVLANIPDVPTSDSQEPEDAAHESQVLESHKRLDNPNCNFTTSERTFVLMALAVARDRLDKTPNWSKPREGFSSILCQEVREILDEPSFRHVVRKSTNYVDGERKSPSDNVIRDIWTKFLKNGTPARANNGGRRRNEEVRLKIKELVEEGKYTSREVATITGASRALVCNAIKELKIGKKLPRKPRAKKAAAEPVVGADAGAAAKEKTPSDKPRAPRATKPRTTRKAKGKDQPAINDTLQAPVGQQEYEHAFMQDHVQQQQQQQQEVEQVECTPMMQDITYYSTP